jgi:hypothetical protein
MTGNSEKVDQPAGNNPEDGVPIVGKSLEMRKPRL